MRPVTSTARHSSPSGNLAWSTCRYSANRRRSLPNRRYRYLYLEASMQVTSIACALSIAPMATSTTAASKARKMRRIISSRSSGGRSPWRRSRSSLSGRRQPRSSSLAAWRHLLILPRRLTTRPPWPGHGCKILKLRNLDGSPHSTHQALVIGEIDGGEQDRAQHLVGAHEMVQIGAGIVARCGAAALLVER